MDEQMDFGQALIQLRLGDRITRESWNGKGQYLELQIPDAHSKMRRPYIYISPVGGDFVPWVASQSDLLGMDWQIYND